MTTQTHTRTLSLALGGAVLAMAAGCNAYDPNLGNTPFRCGTSDPRCPQGYVCVTNSPTDEVCLKKNSGASDVDGGNDGDSDARPFACNDDSEVEPNDTLQTPYQTTIPEFESEVSYLGLAICPDTDVDVFRFGINESGKNLRVDLAYQASQGELLMDVLNSSGASITQGSPSGGDPNLLRANIPNMPEGTYYVQVSAPAGIQNNYGLEIVTSGP